MVFDPVVGKVLLVGGRPNGIANAPLPRDSWLWDGANWTAVVGAPQFGVVNAVYDEVRRVVVVYGFDNTDYFTWIWDGSNWVKQTPMHSPPPREPTQICFDEQSKTTVLFGGLGLEPLGDTWEWNGVDWTQDHPIASPPARWGAAMLCGQGQVVLAGGDVNRAAANDVWTWDGQNWSQATSYSMPDGLAGGGGVFDGSRFLVLLGIQGTSPQRAEVWSYQDSAGWSTVAST